MSRVVLAIKLFLICYENQLYSIINISLIKVKIMTKQYSNKSGQLVIELRQRFLEEYDNNRDLYNDEDVDTIRTNDWYVKRFLLARRRDVDQAFHMIRDTMRWRQQFGLSDMKDTDFPAEFYKVGGLFSYEKDLEGNVVIYLRIRMHRKIPEMAEPIKKFLMFIVNKVDKEVDGNGMAIVFDCSGAGYSNMDMDFLSFLITAGNSYFPVGLKYILVYELSWLLNAFRKIAMSLIPQTFLPLIKFADKSNVKQYITTEALPDFMGGTCKRNYRYVPNGCTTVAKLAIENGFTQTDIDRILPFYEPLLEEADKALQNNHYINKINDKNDIELNEINETKDIIKDSIVCQNKTIQKSTIMGIFPNDFIQLIYSSHSESYESNVLLQNLSDTPIAYKIQCNNANNYIVYPRLGVIMSGANVRCNIQLMSEQSYRKHDKFLIVSVPVNDHKLTVNQFAKLWTENDTKTNIYSHKLLTTLSEFVNENNSNVLMGKKMAESDLNEEVVTLRSLCQQLERRQTQLSLLLYVLLIAMSILLILVLYSHSYTEFLSLESLTIRKFAPKVFVTNE
ncbi:motile sperm domain-containing protein 2-like [Oppia nitens]|uniref:motile sperm domain-containing protein 2-like n=1 Tax=Oppia nitens TaxID=1686743 RepID=UPI0023DA0BE4|nr:motile sperm domain-containing protein 2-like [Oppia nitens]